MFTCNPKFGDIIAVAEPDFNLSKSPIAPALILNNPPPSPLNNDAVIEPLICVFPLICKVEPPPVPIIFV